ncbi:MAG: efflux transporter outer membrane subunit [Gemmataceae bacterium]
MNTSRAWRRWLTGLALTGLLACGCNSLREYADNGFKVGPNYGRPPAPVADDWIDASDARVRKQGEDPGQWWTVFRDPVLDSLVCSTYRQNLTLREAGFRVLQARAQLAIDVGELFPQQQSLTGAYTRTELSRQTAVGGATARRFVSQWNYGFNLAWELDFWGRFRRAVEADSATLDASVENYDDVLVTLLSDVATAYVQMRTLEQRIKYAKENVALQKATLTIVQGQVRVQLRPEIDLIQARSTLEQTEAQIPELEISLRQAANQLCILIGIPPEDLQARLGPGTIPEAPADVVVGVPADLLRRRPDVRRAERQAAAQCAIIGVAEAELYPHFSIGGNVGYAAQRFPDLFSGKAFTGSVGPSFTWNVLNYGRLVNNVRLQDARFQELIAGYQQAVLTANQDVENGLVTFLKAQERTRLQASAVNDAERAVKIALEQYRAGTVDLTRVTLLQQNLVQLQDILAQARGEIGLGLIQVYKALGGGWQIRLTGCEPTPPAANPAPAAPSKPEPVPAPKPVPTARSPYSPSNAPPPSSRSAANQMAFEGFTP